MADRRLGNLWRRDLPDRHRASRHEMRQTGTIEALRFALANAGPLILAPLCPLLGIAFCAVVGAMFGLLYRLPVVGPALAGIGLFFPLAAGLVMTLFLAGLAAGWPLLQAATAGGAEDALDALARIFGYLNQRLGAIRRAGRAGLARGNAGIGSRRPAHIRCDPPDALEPGPDRALRFDSDFLRQRADAVIHDRRGDARLLAGRGASARSRLDLQLFLDGRGLSLPLAAARTSTALPGPRSTRPLLIPANLSPDGSFAQPNVHSRNRPRRPC